MTRPLAARPVSGPWMCVGGVGNAAGGQIAAGSEVPVLGNQCGGEMERRDESPPTSSTAVTSAPRGDLIPFTQPPRPDLSFIILNQQKGHKKTTHGIAQTILHLRTVAEVHFLPSKLSAYVGG